MKQLVLNIITISTLALILINCASSPSSNDPIVSLDRAIQIAVENFEQRMGRMGVSAAQRPVIAVLNIQSMSNDLSAYIINQVSLSLASGNYFIIVDRHRLDTVRIEENFQLSDAVSDASAQFIGRKLGAQFVITGELFEIGNSYRLNIMAIHVETGSINAPTTVNINKNDNQITFFLNRDRTRRAQQEASDRARRNEEEAARVRQAAIDAENAKKREWEDFWDNIKKNAFKNNIEYFAFYQWGDAKVGWGLGLVPFGGGICWSPVPFIVFGAEARLGSVSTNLEGIDFDNASFMGVLAISVGFVLPLSESIKIYADGKFEVGSFAGLKGLIAESATPGFNLGLQYYWNEWAGIDLKYRGAWYKNQYLHSVGIGFVFAWPANW